MFLNHHRKITEELLDLTEWLYRWKKTGCLEARGLEGCLEDG